MKALTVAIILAFGPLACKTIHYQKAEVLNRQNNITVLKDRIDVATANEVDVLAPTQFYKAKTLLERAIKEAQASTDQGAGDVLAEQGLTAIAAAEEAAKNARGILVDALQQRARAQAVHAHLLFTDDFSALDKELSEAAAAIEHGNQKLALEKNTDLATRFGKLEIAALKANISEVAEKAYEQAVESNAQRLAPITLNLAKNELDIARKIIDAEKENFDKAQFHAELARYLALRAKFIADLVTGFKKEHLTDEQMILWYQSQLEQIHSGLPTAIKFDKPNAEVVEHFQSTLKRLTADLDLLESKTIAKENHFRAVTAMFTAEEAEVIRRGDDLIIRSYGFYFPSGQSDLLSRNFDLLNKIVSAIEKFPKSDIEIEGHTDSTGSKKINRQLSEERAKNIADFLIKVAKIDANRVKSLGVGDERPIFSNETADGRAKNRRIEVIIKSAR